MKPNVFILALVAATHLYAHTAADYQQQAVAKFPELGRAGTPFHAKFIELYTATKKSEPDTFKDTKWPLTLAERVADALNSSKPPTAKTPEPITAKIMGASKEQVDAILQGWSSRESRRSSASKRIYYYTKDVDLIVNLKDDRVVGVAVVDRPGAGVTSISESRYRELISLIGQTPTDVDLKKDSSGIHEFYIGDT